MKLFTTSITINRDIQTVFDYFRTMTSVEQFLPKNTTFENLNFEDGEKIELGKAYFGRTTDKEDEVTLKILLCDISEYHFQLYEYQIIDWNGEEDEDFSDFLNYFKLFYQLDFKAKTTNKIKVKQTYSISGVPFWIKIIIFFYMIPEYFQTKRDNKKIKKELENAK